MPVLYLAHPLEADDASRVGLEARPYGVGEPVTLDAHAAVMLVRRGIAVTDAPVVAVGEQTGGTPLTVFSEDTPLPQRDRLAFIGPGVLAADDPITGRTLVSVFGGGQGNTGIQQVNGKTGPAINLSAEDVAAEPVGLVRDTLNRVLNIPDPLPQYLTRDRADALYSTGGVAATQAATSGVSGGILRSWDGRWMTRPATASPVVWLAADAATPPPPTRRVGDVLLALAADDIDQDGMATLSPRTVLAAPTGPLTDRPGRYPDPTPNPGVIVEPVLVTSTEATSLPTTGPGWTAAKAVADALRSGGLTPSLATPGNRVGAVAYTGALMWLATGCTDAALANAVRAYVRAAPGTHNPAADTSAAAQSIGALLAAVDILARKGAWDATMSLPNASGWTWQQWAAGLENEPIGSGPFASLADAAIRSPGATGISARYALTMLGVVRGDAGLLVRSVDLLRRWLGDTGREDGFVMESGYQASWDNTGSVSGLLAAGVGMMDTARPGRDGAILVEAGKGGPFDPAGSFFGAGVTGVLSAAATLDALFAHTAVLMHLGYPIFSWSAGAVLRVGDWMQRAVVAPGGMSAWTLAEQAAPSARTARNIANWLRGGSAYGAGAASDPSVSGLPTALTFGDWLTGLGSQWLRSSAVPQGGATTPGAVVFPSARLFPGTS